MSTFQNGKTATLSADLISKFSQLVQQAQSTAATTDASQIDALYDSAEALGMSFIPIAFVLFCGILGSVLVEKPWDFNFNNGTAMVTPELCVHKTLNLEHFMRCLL